MELWGSEKDNLTKTKYKMIPEESERGGKKRTGKSREYARSYFFPINRPRVKTPERKYCQASQCLSVFTTRAET
jgi:hypothetical protein